MAAELIATVACTETKTLQDTEPGRISPELLEHLGTDGPEWMDNVPVGSCPECGKTHSLWDPRSAMCPKCGTPGCFITPVGNWD